MIIASESSMRQLSEALSLFDCNLHVAVHQALPYQMFQVPLRGTALQNDRVRSNRSLILHTYEYEGLPKGIHLPQRYLLTLAGCETSLTDRIPPDTTETLLLSTFPLQHYCGLLAPMRALMRPGRAFICPLGSWAPCATSTIRIIRKFKPKAILTVPRILERISEAPNGVRLLKGLHYVAYSWETLHHETGERLASAGVHLVHLYGSSQVGIVSLLNPRNTDWRHFRLRSDILCNIEVESVDANTTTFTIDVKAPGSDEYTLLPDVFVRSGTTSADFRPWEPSDEVIKLATGAVIRPLLMEEILDQHVHVNKSLVYVNQRSLTLVVLVQTTTDMTTRQRSRLEPDLYSMVLKSLEHDSVRRELQIQIILLGSGRTFPVSATGIVMRDAAYEEVIGTTPPSS